MKPAKRRPHIKTQEILYEIFSHIQANALDEFFYGCGNVKAGYLLRHAQALIDRYTRESVVMFDPSDPLYGRGIFCNITPSLAEGGLLFRRLDHPQMTTQGVITAAAFLHPVMIEFADRKTAFTYLRKISTTVSRLLLDGDDIEEIKAGLRQIVVHQDKEILVVYSPRMGMRGAENYKIKSADILTLPMIARNIPPSDEDQPPSPSELLFPSFDFPTNQPEEAIKQ